MIKKFLISVSVFALVCVTGFFVTLGAVGGAFITTCLTSNETQLQGTNNQSKIYNYWIKHGYSPAQAAGITASIKHESGYSPFRQEESQRWPRGGYGIAQFTGGQRNAVTRHMSDALGSLFDTYYSPLYGGPVRADQGYIPDGIPREVNDAFLAAQLTYLTDYASRFKPSSIPARTRGLQALTGLTVPQNATLDEFLRTLSSASDAAKAWTFLYEYPGNINSTAIARGKTAEKLYAHIDSLVGDDKSESQNDEGFLDGACSGHVVAPVDSDNIILTGGVGMRTLVDGTRMHEGIDIVSGNDRTILAVMDGTVEVAQNNYYGFGTAVKIDHGNGTHTIYGHLVTDSFLVTKGQHVRAGQPIGTMGNTGHSFGVHLHLQVWVNDVLINPYNFLTDHGVKLTWASWARPINERPGPIYERDR